MISIRSRRAGSKVGRRVYSFFRRGFFADATSGAGASARFALKRGRSGSAGAADVPFAGPSSKAANDTPSPFANLTSVPKAGSRLPYSN